MSKNSEILTQILACCSSGKDYVKNRKVVFDNLFKSPKDYGKNFFSCLNQILGGKQHLPAIKFYAVFLLLQATESKKQEVMVQLSQAHDLLNKLVVDAQFDSTKSSREKGKQFFSPSPSKEESIIGQNYVTLVLETIAFWKVLSESEKNSPFSKIHGELSQRVSFPKTFRYVGYGSKVPDDLHLQPGKTGESEKKNIDYLNSEAFGVILAYASSKGQEKDCLENIMSNVKRNEENYDLVVLKSICEILSKPEYPFNIKFHTLYLLVEIVERWNPFFIDLFTRETPLFDIFHLQGKEASETLKSNSKTKSKGGKDQEFAAKVEYHTLLLEGIKYWNENYGTTDEKSFAVNFYKLHASLSKGKVAFPEKYTYINSKETQKTREAELKKLIQASIATGPDFERNHQNVISVIEKDSRNIPIYLSTSLSFLSAATKMPFSSKFYTLYLLLKVTETGNEDVLIALARAKALIEELFKDAQFDRKKPVDEKGKTFFKQNAKGEEGVLGSNYVELLTETIIYWGRVHGANTKPKVMFKAMADQLKQVTEVSGEEYYIGRDFKAMDQKSLSKFEYIPFRSLSKNPIKESPKPQPVVKNNESQQKTPAPQNKNVAEPSSNQQSNSVINGLRQKLELYGYSKTMLKECIAENEQESEEINEVIDFLLKEVNDSYNNEVAKYIEPVLDSDHPEKENYFQTIMKEGEVVEKLNNLRLNNKQGKISYKEYKQKTLILLGDEEDFTVTHPPQQEEDQRIKEIQKQKEEEQQRIREIQRQEEVKEIARQKELKEIQKQKQKEEEQQRIKEIQRQEELKEIARRQEEEQKIKVASVVKNHSFEGGDEDENNFVEHEEEIEESEEYQVYFQEFMAQSLLDDEETPRMKPKEESAANQNQSKFKKLNLSSKDQVNKGVVPKFKAGDLEEDKGLKVEQVITTPKRENQNSEMRQSSSKLSPVKEYNQEMNKLGQSMRASKIKMESLLNMESSIKKSYINSGKQAPNFKSLDSKSEFESEIMKLKKQKDELSKQNAILKNKTSDVVYVNEEAHPDKEKEITGLKTLLADYQNKIDDAQRQLETVSATKMNSSASTSPQVVAGHGNLNKELEHLHNEVNSLRRSINTPLSGEVKERDSILKQRTAFVDDDRISNSYFVTSGVAPLTMRHSDTYEKIKLSKVHQSFNTERESTQERRFQEAMNHSELDRFMTPGNLRWEEMLKTRLTSTPRGYESNRKTPKPIYYRNNLFSALKLRLKDTMESPSTVHNFKMACLNKRGTLFENNDLQVAISVNNGNSLSFSPQSLQLSLVYRNKSRNIINDFTSEFVELSQASFYKHPDVYKALIPGGHEIQQQAVFSFTEWSLQVPQIYGNYKSLKGRVDVDIFLPILITQFLEGKPTTIANFNASFDRDDNIIVEGDEITLDSSIIKAPMDFSKYFENLITLSSLQNQNTVFATSLKMKWQVASCFLKIIVTPSNKVQFILSTHPENESFIDIILESLKFLFERD